MATGETNILKIISIVTLIVIASFFLWHIAEHFTIPHQLQGPLIPNSTIDIILKHNGIITAVLGITLLIAFIFHRWEKYIPAIALCIFSFVLLQYFPEIILPHILP